MSGTGEEGLTGDGCGSCSVWASVSLEHSRASVAGDGGGLEPCSLCMIASPLDRRDGSSESENSNFYFLDPMEIYLNVHHL